jgi:formiminotetrahydrofolate cyclodeaminase
MGLGSLTIDDFLARLGSSDPTPGGGALAALGGAMAAAMLAMVCNLTIGRPRFADVESEVQALLARCHDLQQQLLALADADAEAYLAVRDAYRLKRESPSEQEARAAAIEASMHRATEVPVETARASRVVLDLGVTAARITNPVALGDVAVAAHLALGAGRGAADQARMNLASLTDQEFVSRMREEIDGIMNESDAAAAVAVEEARRRGTQ